MASRIFIGYLFGYQERIDDFEFEKQLYECSAPGHKRAIIAKGNIIEGIEAIPSIVYPVLGLGGEAGEVQEKIKKIYRDDHGVISIENKDEIIKELGDCLWYLSMISYELGVDFDCVATRNIEKLASRKERNVIHGNGDNR